LVAVGGQRGPDGLVERLRTAKLSPGLVRFPDRHQQPSWWLARFHTPVALPLDAQPELPAGTQVACYLAKPAGQAAGIGERCLHVIDSVW
jgi:hypothetical protein